MYIRAAVTSLDKESILVKLELANDPNTRLETLRRLAAVSGPMVRYCISQNPASAPIVEERPEWFDFTNDVVEESIGVFYFVWAANEIEDSVIKNAIISTVPSVPAEFSDIHIVDATDQDEEEGGFIYDIYVWFSAYSSFKYEVAEYIDDVLESLRVEVLSSDFE